MSSPAGDSTCRRGEGGHPAGMTVFVYRNGQQEGPLTLEEVRSRLLAGELKPEDPAWREGAPEWGRVRDLPGMGPGSPPPLGQAAPAGAVAGAAPFGYGGFWRRLLAFILDQIVMTLVTLPVLALFFAATFAAMARGETEPSLAMQLLVNGLSLVIGWLYYALMESSRLQGTVGKMALGIKVATLEGGRISFARATGRYFAKILSTVTLLIGFIMAAFTARKQALHDLVASTLVIKTE